MPTLKLQTWQCGSVEYERLMGRPTQQEEEIRRSRGEASVKRLAYLPPAPLVSASADLGSTGHSSGRDYPLADLLCAGHKYGRDYSDLASAAATSRHLYSQSGNAWDSQPKLQALAGELRQAGADIEGVDALERSRLMYAVMRGQYDCAVRLLDLGANIEKTDDDGWTALTWAAAYGQTDLVQLLVDRGANLEVESLKYWTPFHYACSMGHAECVAVLIRAGCDSSKRVRVYNMDEMFLSGKALAERQDHSPVLDVLETVVSDAETSERAKAADESRLKAEIAAQTDSFGGQLSCSTANERRLAAYDQIGEGYLSMEPMDAESLKTALVQKRRILKVLADSTQAGAAAEPCFPDGVGSSRGVYCTPASLVCS